MTSSRSAKFLDLIRRSERGRLKVYLGYGPGVGKTYMMLQEAHRLKAEGLDVVVGLVETHGRQDTEALVAGLDMLPRRRTVYHGITIEEFDVDACLTRRPQVAIVDELAHTNVPGSRHTKRYEDVQELLAAGIHVLTAMNVQHLESLYNTVEDLVNVKVRERVPDAVLADADQVVNIDVAPEDLQKRLREGKIYPQQRVAASLENFFTSENLEHLRELAFRELAGHIDTRRRERPNAAASAGGSDQIMVCLSSRGPSSARLLRFGSRLAGRLNRNWYAVYVQTPSEEPLKIDAGTQRLLADTLTLANQLGATVFTFKGVDVAETILRFAREYRVGQIVIGRPHAVSWWRRLLGHRSVAERLIFMTRDANIVVVDAESDEPVACPTPTSDDASPTLTPKPPPEKSPASVLETLSADRVVMYDTAPTREQDIRELVSRIAMERPEINVDEAVAKVLEREAQGSTGLNEGAALPHARLSHVADPQAALAVTRYGLTDDPPDRETRCVFLLLTPTDRAVSHLQAIAAASRLLSRQDVQYALTTNATSADILAAVQGGDQPAGG